MANAANLINFGGGSLAIGDWTYSAVPLSAPTYLPLTDQYASYLVSSYPTLGALYTTPAAAYSASSQNTAQTTNTVNNIAYGNGLWVSTGPSGGAIQTSADGITWQLRPTVSVGSSFANIAYGNNVFVAVGNNNTNTAYSLDGINWKFGATASGGVKYLVYGNGIFVTINTGGSVGYSTDGTSWATSATDLTNGGTSTYAAIGYGNKTFVAIPDNNTSGGYYSRNNGYTWTAMATSLSGIFTGFAYGNGTFVALKSDTATCFTSSDGSTWVSRTMPVSTAWKSVTFGNGVFLAVSSTNGTIAASSPDGITWTARTLPATQSWQTVGYGGPSNASYFIALGSATTNGAAICNLSVTQTTFNLPPIPRIVSNTTPYIKAS